MQKNQLLPSDHSGNTAQRVDGWTLFHKTVPATPRGPTNTVAIDWHLKVRDTKQDVCLMKNYCITVTIQNIISIIKLILTIQQISGFHEL